jgi:hypothetical protein
MLTADPDRYYSPHEAASAVAQSLGDFRPRSVLDSACGGGALLKAMEAVFPDIECGGIDVDHSAIARLKRTRPHWNLVEGDALNRSTWDRTLPRMSPVEVVVLNPPFSMGGRKGLEFFAWGASIRCSLSMAHILANLERSGARRIVAILPESWAYSDLDAIARDLIARNNFTITILQCLKNSTFEGARVNSILVSIEQKFSLSVTPSPNVIERLRHELIRGGLACFRAEYSKSGIPFVHSTALKDLSTIAVNALPRVIAMESSAIAGAVVLLPRVGVPKFENVRATWFRSKIQMSDCVIAWRFDRVINAEIGAKLLRDNFDSLCNIYKGTGARYTTVARLSALIDRLST